MELSEVQSKLMDYWSNWRAQNDGGMPARQDIKEREVGKYLAHVVIFDVLDDPLDFHYRLVGTNVAAHSFEDYTGRYLSQMEGKGPGSKIWQGLDHVRQTKEPMLREVPYVGPQKAFLRSILLFLPLAEDHETPNKIMLVTNFIPSY